MGMRPAFGTAPQKLTGNVPKHILCDTVVAFLPGLDMTQRRYIVVRGTFGET